MGRSRGLVVAAACVSGLALAPAALGATTFHPRIRNGLGLMPPLAGSGKLNHTDVATGTLVPAVYHGGSVMAGGVTVHTIFWAPPGYAFEPAPPGAPGDYKSMIQRLFTDLAADSGASGTCTSAECNGLTVLPQYAQGTSVGGITPGSYSIKYATPTDSIDDTNPYPAQSSQCASPSGTATCLTDGQVTTEIDNLIQSTGGQRGLNNLWFVFLPPNVDECIAPGGCGTNAFAGYHSLFNLSGHGATIYAVAIDPIIEGAIVQGADPNNFPTAEGAIFTAAHEVVEAMTDPQGAGWMDPNGFEVGDKCENSQFGSPLGFASNGSPYNQVINGHQYLFQEMWANVGNGGNVGCVQATTTTTNQLPLPSVNLLQFGSTVTGNVNRSPGGGIGVQVSLLRAGAGGTPVTVANASTTTAANGTWSVSLAPHAVGDDRDEIDVVYSGAGAPVPNHQVIATGNGGNPFNEAGWMGWFTMDAGSAATNSTLTLAPCFQTGQLSAFLNSTPLSSPTDYCNTQTDSAAVPVSAVGAGDQFTWSSNDNRAFQDPSAPIPNLQGGLVGLTALVGEPGSVFCSPETNPCTPPFKTPLTFFTPGGFPSCTADLEIEEVGCTGLVPGKTYVLSDGAGRVSSPADSSGTVIVQLAAPRGSVVTLSNGSRNLTSLHVARLRVDLVGSPGSVVDGSCQPGDYWGLPLATPPTSTAAGTPSSAKGGGSALTGAICPLTGIAAGLPATALAQTDDASGGLTETEVPDIFDTSPINGESLYGKFTAFAESGIQLSDGSVLPTNGISRISLEIVTDKGHEIFKAANVGAGNGVTVTGLVPGSYLALWTLTDVNGDTREVATRFTEQLASGPKATVSCKLAGARHRLIACNVVFPELPAPNGTVRVRITRGGVIVALGHGRVSGGRAKLTMRRLRVVRRGAWRVTLVLSQPHKPPQTVNLSPGRPF